VIEGPAGVGKTSFARALAERNLIENSAVFVHCVKRDITDAVGRWTREFRHGAKTRTGRLVISANPETEGPRRAGSCGRCASTNYRKILGVRVVAVFDGLDQVLEPQATTLELPHLIPLGGISRRNIRRIATRPGANRFVADAIERLRTGGEFLSITIDTQDSEFVEFSEALMRRRLPKGVGRDVGQLACCFLWKPASHA